MIQTTKRLNSKSLVYFANLLTRISNLNHKRLFAVGAEAFGHLAKFNKQSTAVGESQLYDLLSDHKDDIEATWVNKCADDS